MSYCGNSSLKIPFISSCKSLFSDSEIRVKSVFNIIKMALFIFGSVIFLIVYLSISVPACNQTVNKSFNYTSDGNCYCKGNVGSSAAIGEAIIQNTTWFKQFNPTTSDLFGYNVVVVPLPSRSLIITAYAIANYWKYYYPIQWSNKIVHNITLHMFENYDPNNYLTDAQKLQAQSCTIEVKLSSGTLISVDEFNNASACMEAIASFGATVNPYLNLNYLDNKIYQTGCDLDYCEENYCPNSNLITIGFFCATVMATFHTSLKILKNMALWVWRKKTNSNVAPEGIMSEIYSKN